MEEWLSLVFCLQVDAKCWKLITELLYCKLYTYFHCSEQSYIYKCLYWSSNTYHSTENVSNIKMKWIFILSLLVLTLSPAKIVAHYNLPYIWIRSLLCSLFFRNFWLVFSLFSIRLLHYITNASTNSLKNLSLLLKDSDFLFLIYTSCFLGLQYSYYGISLPLVPPSWEISKLLWESLAISIFLFCFHTWLIDC